MHHHRDTGYGLRILVCRKKNLTFPARQTLSACARKLREFSFVRKLRSLASASRSVYEGRL